MEIKNITTDTTQGDESVIRRTELFYKYIYPYRNLIYFICIDYAYRDREIPDIYTNVMTNFFKYIGSYNPERPILSWIYPIAQRCVWEYNKRNCNLNITYAVDLSYIEGNVTSTNVSYTHTTLDNYRELYSEDVLYALDQLSPMHKEALILQLAGYHLTEIAEIACKNGSMINYNIETIKGRIFLAKQKLRKLLTADGKRREM